MGEVKNNEELKMKIIALSGGVASGKNFISNIFKEFGVKEFDADKIVHEILENDKNAIKEIAKNFENVIINSKVNRKNLGLQVFQNKEKIKILENIIHPKVRKKYEELLEKSKKDNQKAIILNIPLLLEKGGYEYDYLIAVIVELKVRKQRFVKRELKKIDDNKNKEIIKSLEDKFENIVKNQILDEERVKKADFILDGNVKKEDLQEKIKNILSSI